MADLNVQPKRRGSILPWILLALGIIALIWFLVRNNDNELAPVQNAPVADSANMTTPPSGTDTMYSPNSSTDTTTIP